MATNVQLMRIVAVGNVENNHCARVLVNEWDKTVSQTTTVAPDFVMKNKVVGVVTKLKMMVWCF